MAVYRLYPTKDTSIYSKYIDASAGSDEILEIDSYHLQGDTYVTRTLVAFDSAKTAQVVGLTGGTYQANLNLYLATAQEVPVDYTIIAAPLYDTWIEGTGKVGDNPPNRTGASWEGAGSGQWSAANPVIHTTSSYTDNTIGGATWYTEVNSKNTLHTQTHNTSSTHDLSINVTDSIVEMLAGTIANNGFLLKLQDSLEFQAERNLMLKYYSSQSHTIFPPSLEIKWDDSDWSPSQDIDIVNTSDLTVTLKGNKGRYTDEGTQRFRINCRPKFPPRTYSTTSVYTNNYYLPQNTTWGIKDEYTETMMIDFDDNYTKVSADSTSNYFDVYMDALPTERHYRLLLKTVVDGSTMVIDNNIVFKVVRNG